MENKFSVDFFKLDGKVAIVTGGNTGLGLSYVEALANLGADIVITAFDDNYKEAKEIVESLGRKFLVMKGDLTDNSFVDHVVTKTVETFGTIDILVNNAGTIRRAPLLDYKSEDWKAVIDINLNAVYHLSHKVAKVMAENKSGKIINIASMLSFQGGKFVPSYTASKHGVVGITKAFANELADHGIQVNAIAPGYIETANTAPIRADEKRNNEILSRIPAGRWGKVSDLMGTVVFLASDASNYVNGHVLAVDGGWLVR